MQCVGGECRTQPEEVTSLRERLDDGEAVEAVSMEMSETFHRAVQLCLPPARTVADHFHVLQQVGEAPGRVIGSFATVEESTLPCMVYLPWNDLCTYE